MSSHRFDEKAWGELDIFHQLGNIGSEVGRAVSAKKRGKEDRMMGAFYRGMDLINATVRAWVARGKSPYEILIAREQFAKTILTNDEDPKIESYFMRYAVVARKQT